MKLNEQLQYWAHMLDESFENKYMLFEDIEGKNINAAERYLKNCENAQSYLGQTVDGRTISNVRDIVTLIRHKIPTSRLPLELRDGRHVQIKLGRGNTVEKGTCRWMLGVCRIYFEELYTLDKNDFQKKIQTLGDILKVIADRHESEFKDRDLNGLSYSQLEQRFKNEITQMKSDEKTSTRSKSKNLVRNEDYTIIPIDSFEQANEYEGDLPWCIVEDPAEYEDYTGYGKKQLYFCLHKDFRNIPEKYGPDYPMDEYGRSALAILINDDGSMDMNDGCTARHNFNGKTMTPAQVQEFLGVDFYETFKPRNAQTVFNNYKYSIMNEIDEMSTALNASKCRNTWDKIFYIKVENNKFIKYDLICDNCVLSNGKFYHVENGKVCDGAPYKIDGEFHVFSQAVESLDGLPREITGELSLYNNRLVSLKGMPETVNSFECSQNEIKTLEGSPSITKGDFKVSNNKLTSLKGAPGRIYGKFICDEKGITDKQIKDYLEFLKNPTPELTDETGHYLPME